MKYCGVLFFCSLFASCGGVSIGIDKYSEKQLPIDSLDVDILVNLIGTSLDELPDISGFEKRNNHTTGDEGETWKSVEYFFNDKPIFVVESNWENQDQAYRITLLSDIVICDDIFVGQQLSKGIRGKMDDKIPSSPDGYLFVNIRNEPRISLQLDVEEYNTLYYGVNHLNDIPDNVEIESIVIR